MQFYDTGSFAATHLYGCHAIKYDHPHKKHTESTQFETCQDSPKKVDKRGPRSSIVSMLFLRFLLLLLLLLLLLFWLLRQGPLLPFFERERFQHLHIRYCIVLASEASPRSSAVYVPFSCHQSDLTLLDPAGSCGRNLIISWNFAFSTFSCILVTFHDNICALTTFDMTTLTEQESGVVLFRLHCAPQGWHVPACPWTSVDSIRRQVENVEILQTPQLKN